MTVSPFFLVAARRSGTTLLRLMLNSHNDIYWESGWEAVADAIDDDGKGLRPSKLENIRNRFDIDLPATDDRAPDIGAVRSALESRSRAVLAASGKRFFGATCHVNADRLTTLWRDAKFVHLYRDPRDVAISAVTLGWESNYWCAASYWIRAESEWRRLRERLSDEQFIDVKFENLVSEPETELRRICDFIGVPFTDHMFDYTESTNYGLPDRSLASRWKQKISRRQASLVEARTAAAMSKYGYHLSGPLVRPNSLQVAWMKLRNRIVTAYRRFRREGWVTFVLGVLVDRAGCTFLRSALMARRKRIHEREIRRAESNYANVARS